MSFSVTKRTILFTACIVGCAVTSHAQSGLEPLPAGEAGDLQTFHPGPAAPTDGAYEHVGPGYTHGPGGSLHGGPTECNAFPYGAPLVGYEHDRTCYPHHYCDRYCTRKARLQCSYWGYPEYFCEPPFGSKARAYFHTQIQNGLAQQLAVYNYDFFPIDSGHGDQLKPRGVHEVAKVARIAKMLQNEYSVVTVEPSGDAGLDEARRAAVFEHLSQMGAPLAMEQVVTAKSAAIGRSGVESAQVFENQLGYVKEGTAGLTSEADDSVQVNVGSSGGNGGGNGN